MDGTIQITMDSLEDSLECVRARRKLSKIFDKVDNDENEASDNDEEEEEEEEDEEEDDEGGPMKKKSCRKESFKESCWYHYLLCEDLSGVESKDGKKFRNRFAIPYMFFTQILTMAEEWFPQSEKDCNGRENPPTSLMLLGTLRMLGKGCSWNILQKLSGVPAEEHENWTFAFLKKFRSELYPIYIHGPRNDDEVEEVSGLYADRGFPGCVGATNCVHIRWDKCPGEYSSSFRNGEQPRTFTSIAYEMTVNSSKVFQSASAGRYEVTSGTTVVHFDGIAPQVRSDTMFTEAEYELLVGKNESIREKGAYLLVPAESYGVHPSQCPFKKSCDKNDGRWSDFVKNLVDDVKNSFDVLKNRFQLLKTRITWCRKSDIDNAVMSCAILCNMLHELIGTRSYERLRYDVCNVENDEDEQQILDNIEGGDNVVECKKKHKYEYKEDHSRVGKLVSNNDNISIDRSYSRIEKRKLREFHALREKLVTHLKFKFAEGKLIHWFRND